MLWRFETNSTTVETPFASLAVFRVGKTYIARIKGLSDVLATRDEFATGDSAQAWAEQEYALLLRNELASLD